MAQILAFAGSTRRASWNKKLLEFAVARARQAGGEVTLVDLADFEMPIYSGDLEADQGLPEAAVELHRLLLSHQGFLIASPEYNGSITPVLKNAIDWASRPVDGVGVSEVFGGKVASLVSASPGGLGGLRGLRHLREILTGIGTVVLPTDVAVGGIMKAFKDDESGELKDGRPAQMLDQAMERLVHATRALGAS
ncbi:MAG: NAD(P)H-dependent oxidoreductase [Acidobacteriota bacterium]